jgi:hypothetical protein
MKILMLPFNRADATAFYRSVGIAKDLELQLGCRIDIVQQDRAELNWSAVYEYDLVLFQRPQSREMLSDARRIREMGIPIWLDYDDDMLNIHHQHIYAAYYNLNRQIFIDFLKLADVVTVSTRSIADSFAEYNANIHVIENGIPARMLRADLGTGSNTTVWRGSVSHESDVFAYSPQIQRVIDEGNNFTFMGYNPFFLRGFTLVQEMDLFQYLRYLRNLHPRFVIVPLIDNVFNRGKSNIAWMEATISGAVCIAQDLPEWDKPGVIRFGNPTNFYNVYKKALKRDDLDDLRQASIDYIRENLTVEVLNNKRINAINTVI